MSFSVDRSAHVFDSLNCCVRSFLHALAKDDGICACSQVLHAFVDHGLCQNGSGCCAVACDIVGLCGDFLDELCAHVLEVILELDLLGDGYAVVCDRRCAVGLVQNYVSALGAQCDLNCICKFVDAGSHCYSCICAVFEILCHFITSFLFSKYSLK